MKTLYKAVEKIVQAASDTADADPLKSADSLVALASITMPGGISLLEAWAEAESGR